MANEPKDLKGWIRATDMDLSRVIRIESSDASGVCTCVTCGLKSFWSGGIIHAGHFKGKNASVRYVEIGIHPQCRTCNLTGVAHQVAYSRAKIEDVAQAYMRYMLNQYGQRAVDAFILLKSQSKTLVEPELRVQRVWYKHRVKAAMEERGLT